MPNFYNKKLVRLVFAKMDSCNHNVTIKWTRSQVFCKYIVNIWRTPGFLFFFFTPSLILPWKWTSSRVKKAVLTSCSAQNEPFALNKNFVSKNINIILTCFCVPVVEQELWEPIPPIPRKQKLNWSDNIVLI